MFFEFTDSFEADVHNLILESSEDGWTFFWQARTQSFSLEKEILMTIIFTDNDLLLYHLMNLC